MPQLIAGQEISDFRSDTVTRPTPAMRRAMAEAVVGDDVFGDDPTVQELEAEAAAAFGHEAGLFVPSGTMGNLIAVKVHVRPGEELLVEELSHTYNNEVGGVAVVAGALTRTLRGPGGRIDPDEVRRFARGGDLHQPRTALLVVENTHNFRGGAVVPLEHLRALRAASGERGLRLHLDGARIWNAVAATGVPAREWGALCDSLCFCLSKGLGAPVGSVLVGSRPFVAEARRVRKMLGGGLRQVGVLAAAGLIALREGPGRLGEDHALARALVRGAAAIEGVVADEAACETNIVFLRTAAGPASYPAIVQGLARQGVLAAALGELGIRFVTHRDVGPADVERALAALAPLVAAHGRQEVRA